LYHGFEEMGFKNIIELPWSSEWLSPYFYIHQREPELVGETRDEVQRAWRLNAELTAGSKHVAVRRCANRPADSLRGAARVLTRY